MAGWHDKHGVLSGDLLKSVGHKFKRKIFHLKRFPQPFKLARGLAGGVYFSVGILNEKIYITLPDTSPDGRWKHSLKKDELLGSLNRGR